MEKGESYEQLWAKRRDTIYWHIDESCMLRMMIL